MRTSPGNLPTADAAASAIPIRPVLAGLTLAILLGALEQTIVAIAAPAIATQLHGFKMIAWVVSAYLIAATVITPIYGKFSDIYGRRAVLSSAILLFILASTGCALAQTMPQLIAFRVLQGLGGGGLISVAQATVADIVPPRERGRYQGYISAVFAVASLAGPTVGGYFTQYLSWRWIFWFNLPLGILALAVIHRSLRNLPVSGKKRRIDYAGAALFASGVTLALICITLIGHGAAWNEPVNLLLLIGASAMLLLFVRHEMRTAEPLIPLSMFANRTVTICCIVLFICFFQFIALVVLLPLRFQMIGGLAPDIAGLRMLPMTLAIPLGASVAGRLMSSSGRYKPLQFSGASMATSATFALAFIAPAQIGLTVAVLTLLGLGIGFQFPTSLVAAQNAVPSAQIGLATSLTSFSRLFGGAVGVAVLTSILIALLRHAAPESALLASGSGTLDLFHAMIANAQKTHGIALLAAAEQAFRELFMISAAISLVSPILIAQSREQELRGKS